MAYDLVIMVIGTKGCGKTSLVDRLVGGAFYPGNTPTTGVIPHSGSNPAAGSSDSFRILDSSYEPESQSELLFDCYRESQLCIAVIDLSQDINAQIKKLLIQKNKVTELSPDIVFHLIGTKLDLIPAADAGNVITGAATALKIPMSNAHCLSAKSDSEDEFKSLVDTLYKSRHKKISDDKKVEKTIPFAKKSEQVINAIPLVKFSEIVSKYTSSSCLSALPLFNNNRSATIVGLQKLAADKTRDSKAEAMDITFHEVADLLVEAHRYRLFSGTEKTNGTSTDTVVSELRSEFIKPGLNK